MNPYTDDRSVWFRVFVLLVVSVAAPLNQFKVPPILPFLMDAFNLSVSKAGLLMSLFATTGLILALPAGFIFQKLGYRVTGLLAVGSIIVGALMGAMSKSAGMILSSRVIEGIGMSFMTVVAPALIAMWFAADKRGAPMGIWALWVPLGSTIMFLAAPPLVTYWNWQGVWWLGCFFAMAAWLLYYFFIKTPPRPSHVAGNSSSPERPTSSDLRRVLRHGDLWLMSFVFCCFNYVFIAFITWTPTFLNALHGISLARASLLIAILTILTMVSLPISGWVSDRTGSRKLVCVVPMILLMPLFGAVLYVSKGGFLPLVICTGFVSGFVPTGVFSASVEIVKDERLAGMAMAVILIGQNTGMLLGPLFFGWIVGGAGGWQTAFWMLVPVCAFGAIAGWMIKIR